MVSCNQVFVFTAEADPTEWTITIVKEHRSHDIFYIRWPNEAVLVIQAILRNFLDARVVNRFHKGITVVEEVGALSSQSFNHCEVTSQGFIDQAMEGFFVFCQQTCPFFKANPNWAIATIINVVARGLVRQEMNVNIVFIDIFEQVYDISMVGNRSRFTSFKGCLSQFHSFFGTVGYLANPTLRVTGFNPRAVHFCNDGNSFCNFSCFPLSSTHTTETR